MPKANNTEIEVQITKALAFLSEQPKRNFSKTAREFGVPENRLRRRWLGGKSIFEREANGRKLNSEQEEALFKYIEEFEKDGATIEPSQIGAAANAILKDAHTDPTTEPPEIGSHWVGRFQIRNPRFDRRPQKHKQPLDDDCVFEKFQGHLDRLAKEAESQVRFARELQREFDRLRAFTKKRLPSSDVAP
jgi:hypothetical protein